MHRYQSDIALRQSHKTMHKVLNDLSAFIYVIDLKTSKILFANESLKKIAGKEIEGHECWKVLQKDQCGVCEFCPGKHLFNTNDYTTGAYHWDHYNEKFEKHLTYDQMVIKWIDGQMAQLVTAIDVTERKKAEEALRQSETMYRQLTVASPDAIMVSDRDGKIIYTSPKTMELFGLKNDAELFSKHFEDFIHPQDLCQATKLFENLWNDSVTFVPQLLMLHANGSEFIGEISAATVKDAEGRTVSLIMVIRDISHRKMEEIELIRAKEKAEESDKLKSAFLANISHEIRTPINGITGLIQVIASEDLPPEKQGVADEIILSCERLVKQIEDIINVAKIKTNQMAVNPVLTCINELMRELHARYEKHLHFTAANKRLTLLLDDSDFLERCVTFVDSALLRNVIDNLIDNAIKFTEKGFIRFGYRQSAPDKLEFTVEDTGIGLPPAYHGAVFESFRQAELTNNRAYGGNGLGLTISHGLVKMMGGEMRIESAEDKGSTFSFTISYLPVADEDEHIFTETSSGEKPFANKLALVVEPEITKYSYYEKLLVAAGFTVQQAIDVQQWLDFVSQTNHIDVLMVNAPILEQVSDEEISQIKSIRNGLPMIVFGAKNDYTIRYCQNYAELAEPVNYEGVLGVMKGTVN